MTQPKMDQMSARRLARRHAADRRFRFYARGAVLLAMAALIWLGAGLLLSGSKALLSHQVDMPVVALENAEVPQEVLSLLDSSRIDERLAKLDAGEGTVFIPASSDFDQFMKGRIDRSLPESRRSLSDGQIEAADRLIAEGRVRAVPNFDLFTQPDSTQAHRAGLGGAIVGSVFIVLIAVALALPLGVCAAIYLEGFAPPGRLSGALEGLINNLAAVPPIVFGLLGLAFLLNFLGMPRSIPLVAGLVLAVRIFPMVIISAAAALRSVPKDLVNGALSIGASRMQALLHHKLPHAAPGILTGAVLATAQALGETAPLLLLGMVAYVSDIPAGPTDPATALPVQIFMWSGRLDPAWTERVAVAIIVLLGLLILLNALAITLRARLETRS